MKLKPKLIAIIGSLAVYSIVGSNVTLAGDFQVMESNVTEYSVGAKLEPKAEIVLGEGQLVRLFQSPENRTFTLRGPCKGTLANCLKPKGSIFERWFGRGENKTTRRVGGTRGTQ